MCSKKVIIDIDVILNKTLMRFLIAFSCVKEMISKTF